MIKKILKYFSIITAPIAILALVAYLSVSQLPIILEGNNTVPAFLVLLSHLPAAPLSAMHYPQASSIPPRKYLRFLPHVSGEWNNRVHRKYAWIPYPRFFPADNPCSGSFLPLHHFPKPLLRKIRKILSSRYSDYLKICHT